MNKEASRQVEFNQSFLEVVLQETSRDQNMAIIRKLYNENKLLIFALPSEKFKTRDGIAVAIVGFSPVDPKGNRKESYIFLSLNTSGVPKIGEESEKMRRFRQTLRKAAVIFSVCDKVFNPFVYENVKDEASYAAALEKVFENKPVLAYI